MKGGFGRQVLGETWAGHYGKNHVMSTRLDIVPEAKDHPVLRGVKDPWVEAGGYWTDPESNSVIRPRLSVAQRRRPLNKSFLFNVLQLFLTKDDIPVPVGN